MLKSKGSGLLQKPILTVKTSMETQIKRKKKIAVLTGAGISAESGISTFRDAGGLWEGHDVMEVASPGGFARNPALVLEFYNQRRRQLHQVHPNPGHLTLVELEAHFEVVVITQNVDDLHERAGSKHVIHLHGELLKARSTGDPGQIFEWKEDIQLGDTCPNGYQLRPHIVWFGEEVPMMDLAIQAVQDADIIMVVGSSMVVYPAAGLVGFAHRAEQVFYVDPNPTLNYELRRHTHLTVIEAPASQGLPRLKALLLDAQ